MTNIANLPRTISPNVLTGNDAVPYAKSGSGAANTFTLTQLMEWLQGNFVNPEFSTQFATPADGFVIQMDNLGTTAGQNVWLIVSPTGAVATGTIILPAVADVVDGQTLMFHFSRTITALTVSGNGATVQGAPGFVPDDYGFVLRYSATATRWYLVSGPQDEVKDLAAPSGMSLTVTGNYDTTVSANASTTVGGAVDITAQAGVVAVQGVGVTINGTSQPVEIDGTLIDIDGSAGVAITGSGSGIALNDNVTLNSGLTLTGLSGITAATQIISALAVDFSDGTVGALPAAAAGNRGQRRFVTDSNAAMTAGIGAIVAGGGANNVPVYSDGTNWRIG